jgi:hypothetical protein
MLPETLKQLSLKVSQYFLDFLESDFKRQQAPRRRVVLQNESGFKAGMSLAPYPSLQSAVWQQLNKPWDAAEIAIAPRSYTRPLSQPLRLILKEQVGAIHPESVQAVVSAVVLWAKHTLPQAVSQPEEWVAGVRQEVANGLAEHIVRPMLSFLDTALKDQAYSSVDSVFSAEGDLIAALAEPLDSALPEVLARFSVSKSDEELTHTAVTLLSLDFVKASVGAFLESFAAADAFLEFRDLETYAATVEGLQLYLYIGTIKYGSTVYPLFYLPIEARRDPNTGTYRFGFSNQLYANKRAIDFALQEMGERQQRQWLSPISERIAYLSSELPILEAMTSLFTRISRVFGFLDDLRLSAGPISQQSDTNVSLSNGLYLCAFEKADEALLNDYEEMISHIRTNKEGVTELFQSIVKGVVTSNPVSIAAAIDEQWDGLPIQSRLVPDTPIPLNEEQQKVIHAIGHHEGRFIVVEGPPGTGKSHTIVAIAADCAFRKKSCLILSDKAEALDVVHDKLSAAMNDVRGSEEFPNPILRLGTEQANFRRLTSSNAITQVAAHVKAARANRTQLESDRNQRRESLRGQISGIGETLGTIRIAAIAEIEQLAKTLDTRAGGALSVALDQTFDAESSSPFVCQAEDCSGLKEFLTTVLSQAPVHSLAELDRLVSTYVFASGVSSAFSPEDFALCPRLSAANVESLARILDLAEELRMPLLGWLFRGRRLRELAAKCQQILTLSRQLEFPADLRAIRKLVNGGRALQAKLAAQSDPAMVFDDIYAILAVTKFPVVGLDDMGRFVKRIVKAPASPAAAPGAPAFGALVRSESAEQQAGLWVLSMQYTSKLHALAHVFTQAPKLEYVTSKTGVERLNTALMNVEVDSRLIGFMESSRADARVLAKLIKDRKKFPEEKFETVKNAFPVMIASIREFGEYMPLRNELIDVLVIDEASQVSVAQAFPALLRAKKVVVMGDTNQFSNTKSSNASIALNQKHRSELEAFFRREVSSQADMLERLSYFDVKRSVLEFCQLCANYSIMLRKHFRSYKELINYSSETFYRGQLQAIKLRTVPLADCIEFTEVAESAEKAARNTNPAEGEHILKECLELLQAESPPTVGVITPFREQQSYLSRLFSSHASATEFRSRLKLKVMTFDSCQGEERNIVFYSMVATRQSDLLNYIFPVQMDGAEELIGEKLKYQRLNVGFSRAQDMVSFVLSKPVSEFKGAIGQALRHFQRVREVRQADVEQTDTRSPMEAKVLEWILATPFYRSRMDEIEVLPQFPLGEYLKQLDPAYKHPAWRVDFLLSVDMGGSVVCIVVEYDGFEYHFRKDAPSLAGHPEYYMSDRDVERQLTLESYGYRFCRLNRFNLGRDPVATLSGRLESLLQSAVVKEATGTVRAISEQATALVEKTAKKCERCDSIKPLEAFFDPSLGNGEGGTGRICLPCKETDRRAPRTPPPQRSKSRWRRR